MHTFHITRSIALLLLIGSALFTGCSQTSLSIVSRENNPPSQRSDNLQALIDQAPDNTTLRIPKGTYIINEGLLVKGKIGLSIIGETGTTLLLTDLDKDVLSIEDSRQIRIFNLLLRHHTPLKEYKCHGSVVRIDNTKDITLANNELNGCGAIGISAQKTQNLTIEHCYIHSNSFNALYLSDVQGLRLWSNVITQNANTFQLYNVTDVQMSDNVILENSGYWRTPANKPGLLEWSKKNSEADVDNDK